MSRQASAAGEANGALRTLPSVDVLLRLLERGAIGPSAYAPHPLAVRAARAVLSAAREDVRAGKPAPARDELLAALLERLAAEAAPVLRRVINATGVIVNTNLGRGPLSGSALDAVLAVASGYSNLEYDLESGERGSRQAHVRALLAELTGAESALAVNNNAAAVLVVLAALAAGREVIVSRGELVEIGGGFRVPDVMRQSGARLVEVGTTNRTRTRDFAAAITPETALLLAVHPSNFRVVGFTETPALDELAALAHAHGIALVHDVGSGSLLRTERLGLAHEPTPQESITAGADLVCFSGDKLLGGPQAGLIVGRHALLDVIAAHPLMRAVRIDKLTLAALEATLRLYRDGQAIAEIPIWRALSLPLDVLRQRASSWAMALTTAGIHAQAVPGDSTIGGGSLPGETLPTVLCALDGTLERGGALYAPDGAPADTLDVRTLEERLRRGVPPVVARVHHGQLLLDPRTVAPEDDASLVDAVKRALASGMP